jgi:adenine-specific DNA glycosylase
MHDPVSHPPHYTQGKIEVIDYVIDQKMNFLEGNVIKYVSRYKFKNGLEDLKKAKFYLEKLISEVERGVASSLPLK